MLPPPTSATLGSTSGGTNVQYTEIIPISDLRQDASGIIKRMAASRSPLFITQRGRAAAVMVSMKEYEETQHELEILRLLARGEQEIEAGVGFDLESVMAEADDLSFRPIDFDENK